MPTCIHTCCPLSSQPSPTPPHPPPPPPATVMAESLTRYTTPSASGAPLPSPLLGRTRTMSCGENLCGGSGSEPPPCRSHGRSTVGSSPSEACCPSEGCCHNGKLSQ